MFFWWFALRFISSVSVCIIECIIVLGTPWTHRHSLILCFASTLLSCRIKIKRKEKKMGKKKLWSTFSVMRHHHSFIQLTLTYHTHSSSCSEHWAHFSHQFFSFILILFSIFQCVIYSFAKIYHHTHTLHSPFHLNCLSISHYSLLSCRNYADKRRKKEEQKKRQRIDVNNVDTQARYNISHHWWAVSRKNKNFVLILNFLYRVQFDEKFGTHSMCFERHSVLNSEQCAQCWACNIENENKFIGIIIINLLLFCLAI